MPFDVAGFPSPLIAVLSEGRRRVAEDCAVFAISKQRGIDALIVPALASLAAAAGVPGDCTNLRRWNDEPDRTQAQVLAVYDRAMETVACGSY